MQPRAEANVHRRAITLVELLVVVAIIAVLSALAVPALVGAIARSQLTRCTNNEYQIGFALLRYDEQHGGVPGWLNNGPQGSGTSPKPCSWSVMLLPFLTRTDIYDEWPTLPNDSTIDTYVCPSNLPPKSISYPPLHYAGNIGATGTVANDGIFLNLRLSGVKPLSLDQIADADGTATTLAFTEKSAAGFRPHTWTYSTSATSVASVYGSGTGQPPVFGVATPPGPVQSASPPQHPPVINRFPPAPAPDTRSFAPSSSHQGGVVVVFCDGHTGFLRDEIQPYVYGQLLTPKSRWQGAVNKTNSPAMQPWLLMNGQRYLLDERMVRP